MRSLLRSVKKRKKRRVLGEVEVMSRGEYSGLELDSKVEMIRALIPLGLMHVEELLDEELKAEVAPVCGQLGGLFKVYSGCRSSCQNLLGSIFLSPLLRRWVSGQGA